MTDFDLSLRGVFLMYKNGLPNLRKLNNAARTRTQIAPAEHILSIPKK